MKNILLLSGLLLAVLLSGCKTTGSGGAPISSKNSWEKSRQKREPSYSTPEWWYARREFDRRYMHWGVIRHPEAPAKYEKWVLLREDFCKAPHRSLSRASADDNVEYKFYGTFAEELGYEPASDEFCPVFILQRWERLKPAATQVAAGPGSGQADGPSQATTTQATPVPADQP